MNLTSRVDREHDSPLDKNSLARIPTGEGILRAIRADSPSMCAISSDANWALARTGRAIAWQCALENCERLVLVNRHGKSECDQGAVRPLFMTLECWPRSAP